MKKLSSGEIKTLVDAARTGTGKAFLTKSGGNSYGAAVITLSGKIYCAGQYSSFNHITNIHAEMAAVLVATMSGDSDIYAIAVLSEKAVQPESMCGICRQFIYEHSIRTGIPITVCMSNFSGDKVIVEKLENLIPHQWDPSSKKAPGKNRTFSNFFPGSPATMSYGMLVVPKPGFMGIVWEPEILPGKALVKLKYIEDSTAANGVRKFYHSLHEYDKYVEEIKKYGLHSELMPGIDVSILDHEDCLGYKPACSIFRADFKKIVPIINCFTSAGISVSDLKLTGSYSAGHALTDSDYDIIVNTTENKIRHLKNELIKLYLKKKIVVPENSSTWKYLKKYTGMTHEEIIKDRKYIDSFLIPESDDLKCSLIFVNPESSNFQINGSSKKERKTFRGTLVNDKKAPYKRSCYTLKTDKGETVNVVSWHKVSNLLKRGDYIEIKGAFDAGNKTLYQINSKKDSVKIKP